MLLKELEEEVTYLYHPDHLGSVSVVSNHRGLPYERVEYLPFGEVWIEETDPATGYIPFRFTSKELDEETGLYYHGARYYEPTISRWMSADPAGWELINPMGSDGKPKASYSIVEAANWYAYVSHNPVIYVDPTGMETTIISMPVTPFDRHMFIAVEDGDGNVTTKGLYPESRWKAIIDIITGKTQPAEVRTNDDNEKNAAVLYYSGKDLPMGYKVEATIEPPEDMTQEEFDQLVLDLADDYPLDARKYNATRGPNSNTYVDDVIESTGALIPDIGKATQQNWGEKYPQEIAED